MSEYTEDEEQTGLLAYTKNSVLKPVEYAVSKPARRAYIGAFFFIVTGATLLGFATTAYLFFYYNYIPVRGFSQPIYLQFDIGQNPYANVPLKKGHLVSDQLYDVTIHMNLPQTPTNRAVGNFMVSLQLFGSPSSALNKDTADIIVQERRPAILTYHSTSLDYIYKTVTLPLYVLGWRKESESLSLPLLEGVAFGHGWSKIPTTARIEIQSQSQLNISSSSLAFRTRLRGLRYLMYNFRITSFVVFTSIFWVLEMSMTVAIWATLTYAVSVKEETPKPEPSSPPIKQEANSSTLAAPDTNTSPRRTRIKDEPMESAVEIYPPATEADVEDEVDEDGTAVLVGGSRAVSYDSGIGTSMESSATRGDSIRRKPSKIIKEEF